VRYFDAEPSRVINDSSLTGPTIEQWDTVQVGESVG